MSSGWEDKSALFEATYNIKSINNTFDDGINFEVTIFPTPFSEEYGRKYGKTIWYCEDWADNKPVVQYREASFHFEKIEY